MVISCASRHNSRLWAQAGLGMYTQVWAAGPAGITCSVGSWHAAGCTDWPLALASTTPSRCPPTPSPPLVQHADQQHSLVWPSAAKPGARSVCRGQGQRPQRPASHVCGAAGRHAVAQQQDVRRGTSTRCLPSCLPSCLLSCLLSCVASRIPSCVTANSRRPFPLPGTSLASAARFSRPEQHSRHSGRPRATARIQLQRVVDQHGRHCGRRDWRPG